MKKVFVDANVLLDFWLIRSAGFTDAKDILTAAEQKKISVYTSSSLLPAALYFLKKESVAQRTMIAMVDKFLSPYPLAFSH